MLISIFILEMLCSKKWRGLITVFFWLFLHQCINLERGGGNNLTKKNLDTGLNKIENDVSSIVNKC